MKTTTKYQLNVLILILLFLSTKGNAQESLPHTTQFKRQIGIRINGDYAYGFGLTRDGKVLPGAGITFVQKFNGKNVKLISGLDFFQHYYNDSRYETIVFKNLGVPVLLNFHYQNGFVSGGIYFDYIAGASIKGKIKSESDFNYFKSLGGGIYAGCGYVFNCSDRIKLVSEARVIKNIYNPIKGHTDLINTLFTNSGIYLGLNYEIN